jgi:hypothetical protein
MITLEEARVMMKSIQLTSGASYNPVARVLNPLSGYMVAVPGYSKVVPRVWSTIDLMEVVNNWLGENARIYADRKITGVAGIYIGLWEHDGKLYLDLSQRIMSRASAINLGKDRKQLAIYDCYNTCDIDLVPKVKIEYEIDADIITDKLY